MRVAITAQEQRLGEATLGATAREVRAGSLRRMWLLHLAREMIRVITGGGTLVAAPAALAMAKVETAILGTHFLEQAPVLSAVDAEKVAEARLATVQELLVRENRGAMERIDRVEGLGLGVRQGGRDHGHGRRGRDRVVVGVGSVVVARRVRLVHHHRRGGKEDRRERTRESERATEGGAGSGCCREAASNDRGRHRSTTPTTLRSAALATPYDEPGPW